MTEEDAFVITRVIAALDASGHDTSLLQAAVDLAARLGAEVAGLFVEDENLLRLADLPAARYITLGSQGSYAPSLAQTEAELRALAAQAAAELRRAAARQGVPWSFRIVRGRPEAELHGSTVVRDLIVVGYPGDLAGVPWRLSSALQEAARGLSQSTLHLTRPTDLARPIVLLRAGSKLIDRTLAAALRLAGPNPPELDVLVMAPDTAAEGEVEDRLAALGVRARVRRIATEPEALAGALAEADGDILVAAADVPRVGKPDDVSALLDCAGLPVMIVRG